ncbi:MAG: hypothetical protein IPP71_19650 [Bacteroidetes bacterium]|nr:hypothetical protein [Bacteroidota bacterium]
MVRLHLTGCCRAMAGLYDSISKISGTISLYRVIIADTLSPLLIWLLGCYSASHSYNLTLMQIVCWLSGWILLQLLDSVFNPAGSSGLCSNQLRRQVRSLGDSIKYAAIF